MHRNVTPVVYTHSGMLVHPIIVALNDFWHWKATGLKVSKFMGIQKYEEEHIGRVKQLKSDSHQDRKFLS